MEDTIPYEVKCVLPISGVTVKVPCHDASAMFRDLLTDPRIKEEDYLFFNDDPSSPPPDEWLELRDINSGLAYRETYNRLIWAKPMTESGRQKVLIPVIGYLDATVTGSMSALSIEFMKCTLGIFNSKAREKGYTWRNVGAIPEYEDLISKSEQILRESTHEEAKSYLSDPESVDEEGENESRFVPDFSVEQYIDSSGEEDEIFDVQVPTGEDNQQMQDFHKILHVILGSYRKIQDSGGIEWDLQWKKLWHLQFIPFWIFQMGDTVEHDKHCGKYGSRTGKVSQLCRYCLCPNLETGEPYASYPRKTQPMITELVRKKKIVELKAISQKFIWNAWYEIKFGLHNDYGIHGACPLEILHWILLGMYKYSRGMFFDQAGDQSKLGVAINQACSSLGSLFQRQSDKRFPRTKFKGGIRSGYLQGHHFTGVILILACTIRTTRGRNIMKNLARGAQLTFFPDENWVQDWLLLLETQLEFEQWLKLPVMSVETVHRLRTKVREFMALTKRVGKREKGMGFKTMNFHGMLHVPDDILCFGPPHTVNTMSNESHHKPDKKSAKRTQRRPKNFTIQVANKIEDRRVIEMGIEELQGRPRWKYYSGYEHPKLKSAPESASPSLSGVKAKFFYCDIEEKFVYSLTTAMQRVKKYKFSQLLIDFITDIAMVVSTYQDNIFVHSEMIHDGTIYRASPHYQGKPWYDWAMFSFQGNDLPAQIRCFIDLTNLPDDNTTIYEPGVYMICETVAPNLVEKEQITSELFQPYEKELIYDHVRETERVKLVVISASQLIGPACVIPDLDNINPRAFLRVLPMHEWATLFELWVNDPHTREFDEPQMINNY